MSNLKLGVLSLIVSSLLIGCGSSSSSSGSGGNADQNKNGNVHTGITGNSGGNSSNGNNGDNGHNGDANSTQDCNNSVDVNSSPRSTLTPELKDGIAYMGNEERLAYDVYHNLYTYHLENSNLEIRQLKNISEGSEIQHVGIVQDIVRKYSLTPDEVSIVDDPVATRDVAFEDMPSGVYDVTKIQNLYDFLYAKGVSSQQDALEVGCMVEVTDVNDLNEYIEMAQKSNASDIEEAFIFLRNGSYNHYWAFDNGLKTLGVTDGCCSLGVINGVDYCHTEYPQNEHDDSSNGQNGQQGGQNSGNGNRNGNGRGHNN
jgi:hypothetical protein